MSNRIEPYLIFSGRCEEALEFYRKTLGAEIEMMMRFDESPDPLPAEAVAPGNEKKIMHASLRIGGARVMASDGYPEGTTFQGFSLSLSVPSENEASKVFAALAEGGSIEMPLAKTFWSPLFGLLTDRFGVSWMVSVAP